MYRHDTTPRVMEPHPTRYSPREKPLARPRPALYYPPPLHVQWTPVSRKFQPRQLPETTLPSINAFLKAIPENEVWPSEDSQGTK